jgi:hypothetical protein
LSACALGAASAAIIAATTPPAQAATVDMHQVAPRARVVPCRADSTSRGATPLLRSLQAMLARRGRRQRPAHFTS